MTPFASIAALAVSLALPGSHPAAHCRQVTPRTAVCSVTEHGYGPDFNPGPWSGTLYRIWVSGAGAGCYRVRSDWSLAGLYCLNWHRPTPGEDPLVTQFTVLPRRW